MSDVHNIYLKASCVCGFPLISMYKLFIEYCEAKNIAFETLLADGLHPNDKGHEVIYNLILNEIGIAKRNILCDC